MTPAPKARPIVRPVTIVNDVFSFIPKNLVNGANIFDKAVNQPNSRKNCITIINGKITRDNWTTAIVAVFNPCKNMADHVSNSTVGPLINPYCAISLPPCHTKLMTMAEIKAKATRILEISHQLTPTREANADSINKLCEKESIIAIINTSFTVNSNDTIAPIPAYKLSALPNTSGIAASPGNPINCINGATKLINQGNIGVYCNIVTAIVIGKTILPNVHASDKPCFNPRLTISINETIPSYHK